MLRFDGYGRIFVMFASGEVEVTSEEMDTLVKMWSTSEEIPVDFDVLIKENCTNMAKS